MTSDNRAEAPPNELTDVELPLGTERPADRSFILSALSLLLAAHRFYLAEPTGQHKGGLFFLLIGIQLLIAAALISGHREEQTSKSPKATDKGDNDEAEPSARNALGDQEKKS